jgi:Family of unknown function (DUF5996)
LNSIDWPALPFREWETTCDTVHMWTQIVGKTRMLLTPPLNHWWHVPLYVTPRGLNTSAIPLDGHSFDVDFDFLAHRLAIHTSGGEEVAFGLYPRAVADFYQEYMTSLRSLGIEVNIDTTPAEFDDTTPYDQDRHHASYDRRSVERFHDILVRADRLFQQFRGRFLGKCSPVHFFWGSFDLAVTRFSGRRAPLAEGADPVTREAYSHEVSSCGFWPGDRRYPNAAFYAYHSPKPEGLEKAEVHPGGWNTQLGEFLLPYDEARAAESPDAAVLDFCQSTYEAGARLAGWDRQALERRCQAHGSAG